MEKNKKMQDTLTVYRNEKGINLIEIKVTSIAEIFNPIDPSPLNKKDLEEDVEDYIVTAVEDFSLKSKINIIIYIPDNEIEAETSEQINKAVNNFFAYRAWSTRASLRGMFKDARTSLVLGSIILFTAMTCKTLLTNFSSSAWTLAVSESLVVAGWVAMWHPVQKFLYEWWPLKRKLHIFEKLCEIKVECRSHLVTPTDNF